MRLPYDVYIGRYNKSYNLPHSKYHNPFVIGKDGTREEVIQKYKIYLEEHPELVASAKRELKNKVLACWCKPFSCHGDILAELVNHEQKKEESERETNHKLD